MNYICPVCGFDSLFKPAYHQSGSPSFEICSSCGYQYGHSDDDRGITFEQWRRNWIEKGMPWSSVNPKPENWDPLKQLQNLTQL